MDKKNILKHFHNKNKQNEFIKENRIKSLYTTIIKSDNQNNFNLNDNEKSSSRQKKRKIYKNNQYKILINDKDERKKYFSQTSYIQTEGNENDNSPNHIKLINTFSTNITPKSNKIINVKVNGNENYNSNNNFKSNNNNYKRNLNHSSSLSNNIINDKMKIIFFSGNKKSNSNININNSNISSSNINNISIVNSNSNSNIKNLPLQKEKNYYNKLFNSCINFNNISKIRKERNLSIQNSLKNKQKLNMNNKDKITKKINLEKKSISKSQNKNQINLSKKKSNSSLTKKNIRNKTINSNTISNNINIFNSQNKMIQKKNTEKSLIAKKDNKSLNKINSPNLHHYNYTTLSSRIKSSVSTLSSTNSSSSLNKHYKCSIISFSAIKQKFFNSTTSINQINNNNNNNNNNNQNNNNNIKINNNNNNNNESYILTDVSMNDTSKKKNNSNNNKYSIITLIIKSNWGNLHKVGITEIQLLDIKNRKISISKCEVINGNEENISRITNNKYHTINEKDMWISSYDINSDKKIKIHFYILNNKYNSIDKIDSIIIWNYNGKELNVGIKEIEIIKAKLRIFKGIIRKGENNIKSDYSYKINLNDKEINININQINQTINNNSNSLHKRNLLSLFKQKKKINKLNFSQSDLNYSRSKITNINLINNKKKNYITFHKIKIKLLSNYGNFFFIGLTGINLIDKNNKIINIENAISIGALPKDLRTIYNNKNDYRVFENIFSNFNNTIDENFMWLTIKNPIPYIEIVFKKEMTLSRIDFWNFNEPFNLDKGVKDIEIVIDDKKKFNFILIKGLGIDYFNFYQKIFFFNYDFINKNVDFNNLFYPIGFVFKIVFIDNYGDKDFISLKNILFYDKNNIDLYSQVNFSKISFSNENDIIYSYQFLDYKKNENSICNNLLFICFEELVQVKYIKLINKEEKLSQNAKNIQIYCDDILFFEGKINQCNESIITFENDYCKLDDKINKDNIVSLNSINSKEKNIYNEIKINDGYMLILDKK